MDLFILLFISIFCFVQYRYYVLSILNTDNKYRNYWDLSKVLVKEFTEQLYIVTFSYVRLL